MLEEKLRKKFKEEFIKDYVCIQSAKNFSDFCLSSFSFSEKEKGDFTLIQNFAEELIQTYKKIFFKLGLMDISLAILEKQMLLAYIPTSHHSSADELFAKIQIKKIYKYLQKISLGLKNKLDKLSLNKFEQNYLNIERLTTFQL